VTPSSQHRGSLLSIRVLAFRERLGSYETLFHATIGYVDIILHPHHGHMTEMAFNRGFSRNQ
jgi:hypothetical protein